MLHFLALHLGELAHRTFSFILGWRVLLFFSTNLTNTVWRHVYMFILYSNWHANVLNLSHLVGWPGRLLIEGYSISYTSSRYYINWLKLYEALQIPITSNSIRFPTIHQVKKITIVVWSCILLSVNEGIMQSRRNILYGNLEKQIIKYILGYWRWLTFIYTPLKGLFSNKIALYKLPHYLYDYYYYYIKTKV